MMPKLVAINAVVGMNIMRIQNVMSSFVYEPESSIKGRHANVSRVKK